MLKHFSDLLTFPKDLLPQKALICFICSFVVVKVYLSFQWMFHNCKKRLRRATLISTRNSSFSPFLSSRAACWRATLLRRLLCITLPHFKWVIVCVVDLFINHLFTIQIVLFFRSVMIHNHCVIPQKPHLYSDLAEIPNWFPPEKEFFILIDQCSNSAFRQW